MFKTSPIKSKKLTNTEEQRTRRPVVSASPLSLGEGKARLRAGERSPPTQEQGVATPCSKPHLSKAKSFLTTYKKRYALKPQSGRKASQASTQSTQRELSQPPPSPLERGRTCLPLWGLRAGERSPTNKNKGLQPLVQNLIPNPSPTRRGEPNRLFQHTSPVRRFLRPALLLSGIPLGEGLGGEGTTPQTSPKYKNKGLQPLVKNLPSQKQKQFNTEEPSTRRSVVSG